MMFHLSGNVRVISSGNDTRSLTGVLEVKTSDNRWTGLCAEHVTIAMVTVSCSTLGYRYNQKSYRIIV